MKIHLKVDDIISKKVLTYDYGHGDRCRINLPIEWKDRKVKVIWEGEKVD